MKETLAFQAAGNRPGSGRLWIWQSHGALAIRAERRRLSTYLPCPHTGASRQARSKLTGLCSEAPGDVGKADAPADLSTDQHAYSEQGGESMNNSIRTAAKTMAAVIAAGAMAVAPVAGTINFGAMTAMADMTGTQPSSNDTGTVKISNLEAGATVKLYKIVEADIDATAGYKGWKATASAGSANVTEKTATDGTKSWKANIAQLMTLINSGKGADGNDWAAAYTGKVAESSTEYSATVAPGEYLAVVEPSGSNTTAYIYSPMLVSLFYVAGENGGFTLSSADQSTTSADGSMTEAAGSAVYAKKSPVTLTKKISNPDGTSGNNSNQLADGDDLQVGDTQNFIITTTIPDYRGYSNLDENKLTFKLEDNQDDGFNKPSDLVVKVKPGTGTDAAETTLAETTNYTIQYGKFANEPDGVSSYGNFDSSDTTANDFVITFMKETLLKYPGAAVTVTYSSVLNSNATQKSSANDNDVTLTYTNSNKTENNTGTLDDHTYDYSFPIDIVKVDASDNTTKLPNAEFSIKRVSKKTDNSGFEAFTDSTNTHAATGSTGTKADSEGNGVVVTAKTGLATFNHLDEGYYEIWESKAPTGYTQNTEHFYIGIAPTYDGDGKLTGYTVKQYTSNGTEVSTTNTSSASLTAHTTITDTTHDTLTVGDTKMSGLPSTGARSALILTIAGIAVMITVMAASRRKKIAD